MTLDEAIIGHRPELYRAALGLTRNADDAKDLVSDTVVRALIYRDKYEEGTRPMAWLLRIMRNHFISEKRRLRNRMEKPMVDSVADTRSVDAVQEFTLETKQIMAHLPRLTVDQRMVLLAFLNGYTHEDIAEILNVPIGTVKSRLHRARLKLEEET